jgi:hypothetical protein
MEKAYDSKTLLIVINGTFHGDDGVNFLFLNGLLKPEIRIIHVIDAFLKFIEIHSDFDHIDANGVPETEFSLLDLIIKVRCDDFTDFLIIFLCEKSLFLG